MTARSATNGALSTLEPLAALSMYDFPHLEEANDAFWAGLRSRLAKRGVAAPERLSRMADVDTIWRSPGLLLSQACGYPLVTRLKGAVRLVATPRYRAPGCTGPLHRSAVIVAAGSAARTLRDLRGSRCAVNDLSSNTGMNLLRHEVARFADGAPFFSEVQLTGAHARSLQSVAEGRADVAAIDAVSMAHLRRHAADLAGAVRILAWTAPSPGLPLITSLATPPGVIDAIREALDEAAADPALATACAALRLTGFSRLQPSDYQAVAHLAQAAADLGYPELA